MAINLNLWYPSQTDPSTESYPFGSFRDRSSPTAKDGTTLQQDWSNDLFSLHWALLYNAGVVPNGKVDTATNSQYYDALVAIIEKTIPPLNISSSINGDREDWVASEKAVGDVNRSAVHKKGDTMTGDLTLNNCSVKLRATGVPANNRGAIVSLENRGGKGVLVTSDTSSKNELLHHLPATEGTLALVGQNISSSVNGNREDWVASEKAVGDVNRSAVHKKGDTMTGDLTLNNCSVKLRATGVPANNRGAIVSLENRGGKGVLVTSTESGTDAVVHQLPTESGTLALVGATGEYDHAESGYEMLPSGLIIQWGVVNRGGDTTRVTFKRRFKTQCFNVQLTLNKSIQYSTHNYGVTSVSTEGFILHAHSNESRIFYVAIGV